MEAAPLKPNLLNNVLVRLFSFGVLVFFARFAYVITVKGKGCDSLDFCFFPEALRRSASGEVYPARDEVTSSAASRIRSYYSSVFQDLIADGYLSPDSKSLCIETPTGTDVAALRDVGVIDSVGIFKTVLPPLVRYGRALRHPFPDNTFDFEFSGNGRLEKTVNPLGYASEVSRTLKPGGFLVVHMAAKDEYSLNSLLELFSSCRFIRSREIDDYELSAPSVREIVLQKEIKGVDRSQMEKERSLIVNVDSKCSVPGYKLDLIRNAEPLIKEEPLKPWLTFKRNIKNIKYLSFMVDISFKNRYVYIDVGARSYSSSIGSWFKKQYPKQNKTFSIYAIEADRAFHGDYKSRKGVSLLPYAAWVRNETLFFEINREPSRKNKERGRGMGRIQAVQSSYNFVSDFDRIQGFDFAGWLKNTVSEGDFVVLKMDVEGTEFHLIPKLIETGAICLIDEMFLECHYNRWQRCCPGVRSPKYQRTYGQCLDLLNSLRNSGVLVHQWW